MSPGKPARLRAVDSACVAQQRISDAITGLAAFESADLEGALKELELAMGRVQEARLAIRQAIIERDGRASFPAGDNAELTTRDDAGAQRVMAERTNAHADRVEARKPSAA